MTFLAEAVSAIEAGWAEAETVIEADVSKIAAVFLPILKTFLPSQLSILIAVVMDNAALLISNPSGAFTAMLSDLESKELTWWNSVEPTVQTAVLQVLASAQAVPTPAAPAS